MDLFNNPMVNNALKGMSKEQLLEYYQSIEDILLLLLNLSLRPLEKSWHEDKHNEGIAIRQNTLFIIGHKTSW